VPYKDPDKQKAYKREWSEARRSARLGYVQELKRSLGCRYCPENEPVALDFHHVSGVKEGHIANLVSGSFDIERLHRELEKCIVVCANCHRKLHAGVIRD
jgi:hypothetical protein